MATFLPNPWVKVLQRFQHSLGGDVLSITYGVLPIGGDPQAALDEADLTFRVQWQQSIDSQVSILPAWGYYTDAGGDLQLYVSQNAPVNGTNVINSPPPNVCWSARKRTQNVGRKFRGRCFMPYMLNETVIDELGVLTQAVVTSFNSRLATWLSNLNTGVDVDGMWLLHEIPTDDQGNPLPPPYTAPTRVTAMDTGPVVVTQRRRLPRS